MTHKWLITVSIPLPVCTFTGLPGMTLSGRNRDVRLSVFGGKAQGWERNGGEVSKDGQDYVWQQSLLENSGGG